MEKTSKNFAVEEVSEVVRPRILFYHTQKLGWITYSQNVRRFAALTTVAEFSNLHPVGFKAPTLAKRVVRKKFNSVSVFLHTWIRSPLKYAVHLHRYGVPDLVHCASQMRATGPWLFRGKSRIAVTIDCSIEEQAASGIKLGWFYRIVTFHERWVLKSSDLVFCTSKATRDFLVNRKGLDKNKIKHCPYAVSGLDQQQLELGIKARQKNKRVKLVFVGNDFERKGGSILVNLHQEFFAESSELHIFSSSAPDLSSAKNIYQYRNVDNTTLVRGFLPGMDVFVLPTSFDQSPIAIIEAMAVALPVVAYNTGGIGELIEDEVTGCIIEKSDITALRKKIQLLVDDSALRLRMGREGHSKFKAQFDASVVYKKFINELVDLATSNYLRHSAVD